MIDQLSFRDPDGFVFKRDDIVYRAVKSSFANDLAILKQLSALQLLEFTEDHNFLQDENIIAIIRPVPIPVITYPWEWTPEMLRDASFVTLELLREVSAFNATLKDASFFNIQFLNGKPIFIDHLSVKTVEATYPWSGYNQFLRHFVYPLLLCKYHIESNLKFLRNHLDGLQPRYVANLLPAKSIFNLFEILNVHVAAKLKNGRAGMSHGSSEKQNRNLKNLIEFATSYIRSIQFRNSDLNYEWEKYYSSDVDSLYFENKQTAIHQICSSLPRFKSVTDVGANTGAFSEIALQFADSVLSVESNIECCEIIYRKSKQAKSPANWTVIFSDITEPSPALGWMNTEHTSLLNRIKSEMVFALAVMHHLIVANRIPIEQVIHLFYETSGKYVVLEYIDPDDPKVRLLHEQNSDSRTYDIHQFYEAIRHFFRIESQIMLNEFRTIFLLVKIDKTA